ncbi:MAG TPA: tetratricopeptide repeat protein, partial [Myxococcota bacterium]|nr:tetratricopeptide repeat protein [Myxococcota bacterium]
ALDVNQKALDADPKAYRAAYNRGVIFHKLGDIESEIAAYRKALDVRPAYAAALYNLAAALSLKGERDGAIAAWDAYVKAARTDPGERVFLENARKELLRLKGL